MKPFASNWRASQTSARSKLRLPTSDETLRELGDQARQLNGDVSGTGRTEIAIILVVAIIVGSVLLNLIPRE